MQVSQFKHSDECSINIKAFAHKFLLINFLLLYDKEMAMQLLNPCHVTQKVKW